MGSFNDFDPWYWVGGNILTFLLSYVGKGHSGLYKAPTVEERRKRNAKRGEGGGQIKFIGLKVERWQVLGFREGRRRQDIP